MIEPKIVNKPWGYELWISDGKRTPYASKKIFFKAGNRTSLQVHEHKFETNYVLEGEGILLLSPTFFNCKLYNKHNMNEDQINEIIRSMVSYKLSPGVIFDVIPGHLHRVIATTDLTFMETSTPELDDVIRLADDTNRGDGRIDAEHR